MSSSVFYKFKNSREPERIVFDGTGISVFELKREIIIASGLGDGSDFDLHIYPEDQPTSEYDDDTTIISRSSTVIAVRRPAARGHGRGARYVTGRAPVRAIKKADAHKPATTAAAPGGVLTEQDAEAAFLQESAQVWDAQKESLSHLKPVYHNKKKPVNVPTHEPPPGYVCYRCQKKGHWIQACPTNDDPDFKPVARAKRTTGIPRSFLKTVEKPTDEDDARGVMLNADGEYVQVMADTKTWEKFQEKTNAAKARAASVEAANKELAERGLECPIDKRLFVDPVKTPCCGKTYCHDCIENALADGDLVCPNCSTDGVLIDDLAADEEMLEKIRAYEAEKLKEKVEKEQQAKEEAKAAAKPSETDTSSTTSKNENIPAKPTETDKSPTPSKLTVAAKPSSEPDTSSTTSKKRKSPPTEIKPPTAPKAMRTAQQPKNNVSAQPVLPPLHMMNPTPLVSPMPMPMYGGYPMNGMNGMNGMPGMNGMNGMGGMNGMNSMNGMGGMNGMNPMNGMNGMNGGYNQGWNQHQQGYGSGNGMGYNQGWGQNQQGYNNQGWNNGWNGNGGMNGGWNQWQGQ